jgi:hypothetical protein
MSSKRREVATILIRTDRPTDLTFDELYTWVIWQFPQPKAAGLCGAVRPPIANHSWFPALIRSRERQVLVYGHLKHEFATPAQAAEWLESQSS